MTHQELKLASLWTFNVSVDVWRLCGHLVSEQQNRLRLTNEADDEQFPQKQEEVCDFVQNCHPEIRTVGQCGNKQTNKQTPVNVCD